MKCLNSFFIAVSLILLFHPVSASPVKKATADLVARNFLLSQEIPVPLKSGENAGMVCQTYGKIQPPDETSAEFPAFYVYNTENQGFIIVSGDDALPPVLAYSRENPFDFSYLSTGLEALLKDYEKAINYVAGNNLEPSAKVKEEWSVYNQFNFELKSATLLDSVTPMTTTKWGYGSPYNNLCPADPKGTVRNGGRCPVGCAAVAMAQVMKYWDNIQRKKANQQRDIWYTPLKGYGSNTYGSSYGDLSADFGKTFYDWNNMPDEVNNDSPEYQKKAVATLMYHCGVSVNMHYEYNSSGAYFDCDPEPVSYLNCVKKSFSKYWGYSNSIKVYYKSFSDSIWEDLIKKEIVAGRPVIYAGEDVPAKAAHAMVIDGFDKTGLLSINWGLFGYNNGYYRMNSLLLKASETETFNYINNGMIMTGIEPYPLVRSEELALDHQVRIWPNPAVDRLHIDLSASGQSQVNIDILNSLGMKISEFSYTNTPREIPLEKMKPGVYFVRVHSRDKMMTRKFIVK